MAQNRKLLASELHKQPKRSFRHRVTLVNSINDCWAADLVDMGTSLIDDGYRYILTVIDCLSRFAWVVPLKRKTKDLTAEAFKSIFRVANVKPNYIWTDRGREFNEKTIGVPIHFAYGPVKVGMIERFNKTLKNRMWFELTSLDSENWIKILPDIVKDYNDTIHSSIGVTPRKAWSGGDKMEKILLEKQHLKALKNKYKWENNGFNQNKPLSKQAFKINDRVRTVVPPPKSGDMFKKGYKPQWSSEIYVVTDAMRSSDGVWMYKIKAADSDRSLSQHFYNEELQKSAF